MSGAYEVEMTDPSGFAPRVRGHSSASEHGLLAAEMSSFLDVDGVGDRLGEQERALLELTDAGAPAQTHRPQAPDTPIRARKRLVSEVLVQHLVHSADSSDDEGSRSSRSSQSSSCSGSRSRTGSPVSSQDIEDGLSGSSDA